MKKRWIDALMLLIGSAVSNSPLSDAQKAFVTEQEDTLQKVISAADKHRVLPVVTHALFSNGLIDLSTELGMKLRKQHLRSVFRCEQTEYELQRVSEAFSKAQIYFIPLKGAVIRHLYPEPWMRTSCDIDILVRPEQLERACAVLSEQLKFSKHGESFHDVMFITENKVHIELHFDLVEDHVKDNISAVLKRAWDFSRPVDGQKYHMAFSNEFFVLYHIIHMAKHMMSGGCGVRPFVDLLLMRDVIKVDPESFAEMLECSSVSKFAAVCEALCDVWFKGTPHTELSERLERFVVNGGVYGTQSQQAAIAQGKGKSKRHQFLDLAFPKARNMKLIYPTLQKHIWLLPFCYILRWFRVFDSSKRTKVDSMVSANDAVSESMVESVSKLLSDLDLNNK